MRKLLVANRGEIAVRIFRACRDLGLTSVAVYSEADVGARHVREADEAHPIGGAPATESYLNVENIVAAIRASGADAVHPGYGFLSESASFARAVEGAGAVWVGPTPEAMEQVGYKVRAKEIAARANVPTVPGYDGDDLSVERLSREAGRIGYPVLVKASAGGGGRGMREVRRPEGLADAVTAARREAEAAFSDGSVFLEKLVEEPRHIEVQVLADHHGNVVHLYERECSIQRRHQKVVEESPSPALDPELRREMCEAAVRLAREVGYTNAGTVEFLLSEGGEFYFLEMNARLQVEHPVTECVTGRDLVKAQLAVASGERLPFSQGDISVGGSAIEVRLYAEDEQGLPAGGRILAFDPPEGAGVRNDSGVSSGDTVSLSYDAMISKLIVHAPSRERAVERLSDALERYTVAGPATNLPLLRRIVATDDFVAGLTTTAFLERNHLTPESADPATDAPPAEALAAAALADASLVRVAGDPFEVGGWRPLGQTRHSYRTGEKTSLLEVSRDENEFRVSTGGESFDGELLSVRGEVVYLVVRGRGARAEVCESSVRVRYGEGTETVEVFREGQPDLDIFGVSASEAGELVAPMPGVVVNVLVREGQDVVEGQTLLVLEAMKMEYPVVASGAGRVGRLPYRAGDLVEGGAVLVEVREDEGE